MNPQRARLWIGAAADGVGPPWPLYTTRSRRTHAFLGPRFFSPLFFQLVYFLIGCFSFPPHSLIGLTSRELVPENMRSTAGCIAKAVGQLGAAAGGLPLQQLAEAYGWGCVGYVNAVCAVVAAVIFFPLWNQMPANPKKAK